MSDKPANHATSLKRGLTLPLLTLYGLGVTIGAGIYVLVGITAAEAGLYAPISFIIAAGTVAFTGFTYAELCTRYPVSAGEAAFVEKGFNSNSLALVVGLLVIASGVVSSAAISIGATGYLNSFIPLSPMVLTALIIMLLGLVAVWGIVESVTIAAIFTLIELAGLALVLYYGVSLKPDLVGELGSLIPPATGAAWAGITSAGLLAFFAFVGFEDIANVAEEVKDPGKTLPPAIILTLLIATLLYVAVVSVIVLAVPMETLTKSAAPLALVFEKAGSGTSKLFDAIASIATINGLLIQMIMASRVLYGMASRGTMPAIFAPVNSVTRTPLNATLMIVVIVLALALFFPIAELAKATSTLVLFVFVLVNLALLSLKWRGEPAAPGAFEVPLWVPVMGCITSSLLLLSGLF